MEQVTGTSIEFSTERKPINPFFIIIALITLFVIVGCLLKEIEIIKGMMLILFGSFTAYSFYKLFDLIVEKSDTLGMERGIPGIDGSVGGWRLTPALTMLIVASSFTILTLLVYFSSPQNTSQVSNLSTGGIKTKDSLNRENKKDTTDTTPVKFNSIIDSVKK